MSSPSIRHAVERDASAVQQLMAGLGYSGRQEDLRARIAAFGESQVDEVLVAVVHDEVVGFAAVNMAPLFAEGGMFARITALVVSEDHRRGGIARSLVLEAERRAQAAGCSLMQVAPVAALSVQRHTASMWRWATRMPAGTMRTTRGRLDSGDA